MFSSTDRWCDPRAESAQIQRHIRFLILSRHIRFHQMRRKWRPYQPLSMIDGLVKRSTKLNYINSVHSSASDDIRHPVQMGQQLAKKMERVDCLRDIIQLHDRNNSRTLLSVASRFSDTEQLLHLVVILKDEWNNIVLRCWSSTATTTRM